MQLETTSRAFKKWLKRIEDTETPWTEKDIIYFRKAVGSSGLKDPTERALLRSLFVQTAESIGGYRITREHCAKGTGYVLSKSLRQDGRPRKGCIFTPWQLGIFQNLQEHRLVDLWFNGNAYFHHFLPVYRAIAKFGDTVDYVGTTYSLMRVI